MQPYIRQLLIFVVPKDVSGIVARFFVVCVFFIIGGAGPALAAVDLTPWLNPAGANNNGNPPPYDISTCASPTVGTACPVTVTVTNLGDEAVTSTNASPVEIQLSSLQGSFNVTESLPDGTVINAGQAIEYTLNSWVPQDGQMDLFVRVNPSGNIPDVNNDNDVTTLPVIVTGGDPPVVDITPWLNPAGANNNGNPPPYDIETCASPTDGVPCAVTVTITNIGNTPVTSTVSNPVEIRLLSIPYPGGLDVMESLPDGTVINPGQSVEYTFQSWTPEIGQTELVVRVNPNGYIGGENLDNNETTRPVIVGEADATPVLYCEIKSPGSKWLAVLPVVVDVRITDATDQIVFRNDIPASTDGRRRGPRAEITCGSAVKSSLMLFVPGTRRHPINDWVTAVSFPRKGSPIGSCTVNIKSGDEDAYTMDTDSCQKTYQAVKKLGR